MISGITVVNVQSASFTGTTWINMLLGAHEDALALGPLDGFWQARTDEGPICKVCGADCDFWPDFNRRYESDRNLFVQLNEYSGRRVFIVNNPDMHGDELAHPGIRVVNVVVVRDGRAITASFLRKNPQYGSPPGYESIVRDWFQPITKRLYSPSGQKMSSADAVVRYEDVVNDVDHLFSTIGSRVGLDYSGDAADYWKFEQHPVSGSGGPMFVAARLRGNAHSGDVGNDAFYDYYRGQVGSTEERSGVLQDERWRTELTIEDQQIFDRYCGSWNSAMGYPGLGKEAFPLSDPPSFLGVRDRDSLPKLGSGSQSGLTSLVAGGALGSMSRRLRGQINRVGRALLRVLRNTS